MQELYLIGATSGVITLIAILLKNVATRKISSPRIELIESVVFGVITGLTMPWFVETGVSLIPRLLASIIGALVCWVFLNPHTLRRH